MKQDGIKRASIDKLKSRFETAYYSEDMVITPLVMFRELDDLTALIQGVSIGVTVSGTAKIKINGKLHELRPNTLFIFNENTVIEQVKTSIRSSGYMIILFCIINLLKKNRNEQYSQKFIPVNFG